MGEYRAQDETRDAGVLVGERLQEMPMVGIVDERQVHDCDTEEQISRNNHIQAEPAMQQNRVQQNDAKPDRSEKYAYIDADQIRRPEQKPCANAQQCLTLACQKQCDREQIREHKERDVRLEVLTGDRDHS